MKSTAGKCMCVPLQNIGIAVKEHSSIPRWNAFLFLLCWHLIEDTVSCVFKHPSATAVPPKEHAKKDKEYNAINTVG